MARRRDLAAYRPLVLPAPDTLRLPDVGPLSKKAEAAVCHEIAKFALDHWLKFRGPKGGAELSEALGDFETDYLDLFAPGSDNGPEDRPSILAYGRLGYVVGQMENASGVARTGESEHHYTSALGLLSAQLSQQVPQTVRSDFAMECGYYLARVGDEAYDDLIEIAEDGIETLRG